MIYWDGKLLHRSSLVYILLQRLQFDLNIRITFYLNSRFHYFIKLYWIMTDWINRYLLRMLGLIRSDMSQQMFFFFLDETKPILQEQNIICRKNSFYRNKNRGTIPILQKQRNIVICLKLYTSLDDGECWVHCTMVQPTLCLSLLNELVEELARSQQSKLNLLEKLVRKRRIEFIFSSIIMYKSPATFMKE